MPHLFQEVALWYGGSIPCLRSHSLEITGRGLSVLFGHSWALADSGHQLSALESLIAAPFQVQLPETEECRHTDPEALAGSLL